MKSRQIAVASVMALTLGAVACSDATEPEFPGTFEVSITNLTSGQPFTPPLVATHDASVDFYTVGSPASTSLQEIAENGNLAPLTGELDGSLGVAEVVTAVAGDPPPLMPGQTVTFNITATEATPLLSFAAMLICTNDGFAGIDAVTLPTETGVPFNRDLVAYDAGTELNTEDFADMVPPCPALTGVTSTDPGTGASNPALAENGVVTAHAGITGAADLQTGVHGWPEPVARITITRTN